MTKKLTKEEQALLREALNLVEDRYQFHYNMSSTVWREMEKYRKLIKYVRRRIPQLRWKYER